MSGLADPPRAPRRLRGARVLVMADLDLRTALRGPLGAARAVLLDAPDAHAGLALALSDAPDVVVLGPRLPDAEPAELCRRLCQLRATRGLPVLGLSGDAAAAQTLLDAGAADTAALPLAVAPTLSRLANLVARARAEREAERLRRLLASAEAPAAPGRVHGVVAFSDLRALTTGWPEAGLDQLFADLHTVMDRQRALFAHYGASLRPVAGDGIAALFVGPRAPDQAVRAAVAVRDAAQTWSDLGSWSPAPVAMGVADGPVMRGQLGAEAALFGPTVSRAMRLCGLAEPFEVRVAEPVLERSSAPWRRADPRTLRERSGASILRAWAVSAPEG